MILTRDAAFLNSVANHPDVRPWLGTDGASPIDFAPLLARQGTFALVNEHGGFVFVSDDGGATYEFHTQFLPEGRGREALKAAHEAAQTMFGDIGVEELRTYVPHENRAALGLVRLAGFRRTHEDGDNSYWALDRAIWQARQPTAAL